MQTLQQTSILDFPQSAWFHTLVDEVDLIGDRVFVESRQNAIKMKLQQSDGSEGKISNPHKNLTKHHTCRANFLLARQNTQPLVALNIYW